VKNNSPFYPIFSILKKKKKKKKEKRACDNSLSLSLSLSFFEGVKHLDSEYCGHCFSSVLTTKKINARDSAVKTHETISSDFFFFFRA